MRCTSLPVGWGHKAHLCPAQQESGLRAFCVASRSFLEEVGLEEGVGVGWEDGAGRGAVRGSVEDRKHRWGRGRGGEWAGRLVADSGRSGRQ